MKKHSSYIPALHFHWLTRWYDPVMQLLFPEDRFNDALLAQAHIQSGQKVLDMGCGTGTFALRIIQDQPNAAVYGLDVDPRILGIAHRKIKKSGERVLLQQGTVACLPYHDESFDHVFACLMLHHLTRRDKQQAINEAFRVLKPGGQLHVLDFSKPHDSAMWLVSLVARWFEEIHDNVLGLLPVFMLETGFCSVEERAHYRTMLGTMALSRAEKPMN